MGDSSGVGGCGKFLMDGDLIDEFKDDIEECEEVEEILKLVECV